MAVDAGRSGGAGIGQGLPLVVADPVFLSFGRGETRLGRVGWGSARPGLDGLRDRDSCFEVAWERSISTARPGTGLRRLGCQRI